MTKSILFLALLLTFHASRAATDGRTESPEERTTENRAPGYGLPVRIPIFFSANYGELRPNHFHAGVDIKTQGVIGKPIYSIADGYVSRISVGPSGFGKALYIAHRDGTTSVYGHLERFAPQIEKYVHEQQYLRKSFRVELYPPEGTFVCKRGELIAYSGNRGSSGGPHLHLEVRETATQRPLNPVVRGVVPVADTIPPKAVTLYYVSVDSAGGVPVHTTRLERSVRRLSGNDFGLKDTAALQLPGPGYFAVEISERKNGTANPMGVYTVDAALDGTPFFGIRIDGIGFDVSRYVNAAMLYKEGRGKRNGVYKLYKQPNNRLPIYNNVLDRGIVSLKDGSRHTVSIEMADDCANRSTLTFSVIGTPAPQTGRPEGYAVQWNEEFGCDTLGLKVRIPAKALYESAFIAIEADTSRTTGYSPLYRIAERDIPLQLGITIGIDAGRLPEALRSKALLGVRNGKSTGSAGGKWVNGRVEGSVRSFGDYCIVVDTTAPRIVPRFQKGADLSAAKSLSLEISDDLSGIASYTATIDGHWALLEYDPKTARITHYFDDSRWPKGSAHVLVVTVRDNKGNKKSFKTNYIR